MSLKLFRQEVLDAKQTKWMGNIILSRPFSFTFLTFFSLSIGLIILIFSIFGSYTKRSTVQGQLVPESGLIQIYSTQQGIIVEKNAYEGKSVKKGDILYVVSTTSYGENGDISADLKKQTKLKEDSIRAEKNRLHLLHLSARDSMINQIKLLEANLGKISILIQNQKIRVDLGKANQLRYERALQENAVSSEDYEQRKNDLLSEISQHNSLQREKITLEKQLEDQLITLASLDNSQQNEIEQLERLLSENTQELLEIQLREKIIIKANASGVISTVNAELGQFIDLSKPLLTILPNDTKLIAQLYVPSRAIGFIEEGDKVLLRYQAYPYQKFGHAQAEVISVAKTALATQDLKTIGTISLEQQTNNEPVYLVRAKLEKQHIKAYGRDMSLQAGMRLEGDALQETRRLYEWAIEPLFSVTGKF
jgi:membrane fusion protein